MKDSTVYVILGGHGYIGEFLSRHLGKNIVVSQVDILAPYSVQEELYWVSTNNPKAERIVVVNCAAFCRPTIAQCDADDANRARAARVNSFGPQNVAQQVIAHNHRLGVIPARLVHISTSCLWKLMVDAREFVKPEPPNFYAMTKWFGELGLEGLNSVIIRIRRPFSYEYSPNNFVTKMESYKTFDSHDNSYTLLEDLSQAIPVLSSCAPGIYNLACKNPIDICKMIRIKMFHNNKYNPIGWELNTGSPMAPAVTMNTNKIESIGFIPTDMNEAWYTACKKAVNNNGGK